MFMVAPVKNTRELECIFTILHIALYNTDVGRFDTGGGQLFQEVEG